METPGYLVENGFEGNESREREKLSPVTMPCQGERGRNSIDVNTVDSVPCLQAPPSGLKRSLLRFGVQTTLSLVHLQDLSFGQQTGLAQDPAAGLSHTP